MGVKVAVLQVAVNTGTGNQTFTKTGFGTPKAALFIVSRAATNGTVANGAKWSYGAATGTTNRWCVAGQSENGQGTTDSDRYVTDTGVVVLLGNDGSLQGVADFVSFNEDNVILNWSTAPFAAVLLTIVLFGGTDLSAHANKFVDADLEDGATDVTGPGFEPDLVFVGGVSRAMDETRADSFRCVFGVCENDGGVDPQVQGGIGLFDKHGEDTSLCGLQVTSGRAIKAVTETGTTYGVELTTFDGSGFSATTRDAGAGGQFEWGYLALAFGGVVGHWVGAIDTPTATGDKAYTGPGFTPQFVMLLMSHASAYGSHNSTGPAAIAAGIGVITADDEFANGFQIEDAQGTSDTQNAVDSKAVWLPTDDGSTTNDFIGTGPGGSGSLDANGFTINFSAVDTGTVRKWFALAIEKEAVAVGNPWHVYAQQ